MTKVLFYINHIANKRKIVYYCFQMGAEQPTQKLLINKNSGGHYNMNKLEMEVKEIVKSHDEPKAFVSDVLNHGCISGIVSELIYTVDCYEWFDTYYEEIMELAEEIEESTGEQLHHRDTDLKTWYSWLSFEETVRKLYEV